MRFPRPRRRRGDTVAGPARSPEEAIIGKTAKELKVDPRRLELLTAPYRSFRAARGRGLGLPGRVWHILSYQFLPYYFTKPPRWRHRVRKLTWRRRPPPDFSCTGVVRSGTSALSNYVFQHPCVVLPLVKEPVRVFTVRDVCACFPTEAQREEVRRRLGNAVSGYCVPGASSITFPYRLKAMNGGMQILVILRDPIDRAFSHWRWEQMLRARHPKEGSLTQGYPSFAELVDLEIADAEMGGIGWTTSAGVSGFLKQGIYLSFLHVLYALFPADRIRIVSATDFFADPLGVARQCYDFLGLPPCEPGVMTERNPSPPSDPMDEGTREKLRLFFEPHNQRLYEFLNRDFGW